MKKVTAASSDYLLNIFSPPHNSVQGIYEDGTYPLMVIGKVYNTFKTLFYFHVLKSDLDGFCW